MKGKLRVLVCAALCVALGVGTAWAEVQIDGVDGTTKSLDVIGDIVGFTTGSHIVPQEAFLKVMKRADDTLPWFIPVKGDGDGSNVSLSEGESQKLSGYNVDKTNTGFHPALGTAKDSDGTFYMLVPSSSSAGVNASVCNFKFNDNSEPYEMWHSTLDGDHRHAYVTDAAGGLFPYGKVMGGYEVFAIAYFTCDDSERPGLGMSYTAYLMLVDTYSNHKTYNLGSMTANFPSVRVAVGDFDHDGTNELAVIRDGGKDDYYLQVFSVDSDLNTSEKYHTSLGARDPEGNNIDGCDVVAGDFDGDGHTDLAAVYSRFMLDTEADIELDGCPTVTTFRWNGKDVSQKTTVDEDRNLITGSDNAWRSSSVPHYGLVAEAGDLNGDGKDEIVFLTPSYGGGSAGIGDGGIVLASVWKADDKDLTPSRMFWKNSGVNIFGHGSVGWDPAECNYLPRSISLALVPVGDRLSTGGTIRRVFFSRCQGGDEVQSASGYKEGDDVFYMTPQFSETTLTGLSDTVEYKYTPGNKGRMMGLVHADFYGQSSELGDPTHMVFEAERSYFAEVQAVPYHVDYVQVPFGIGKDQIIPTEPSVMNLTYRGHFVKYSKSETDSTKTDVAFKTTDTMEWGVNAQADTKIKLVGAAVSGGFKDAATMVETATKNGEATTKVTIEDQTDVADNALLYKTNRHVWRYPVLSDVPGKPDNSNGQCFMTFSLCDEPINANGGVGQSSQFDDYNPIHEEGNLFSYPTKLENIPYYNDRQCALSNQHDTTVEKGSTSITLLVSESGADTNGTTTTSKKTANGSTSVSLPIPKITFGGGASASYSSELTNTDTFTKSYSTSEQFLVKLMDNELGFDYYKIQHAIHSQLYSDAAGVMKVGFAVNLKSTNGDTAEVWEKGGMYDGKPDPSLVLPARFARSSNVEYNTSRPVWIANSTRKSAIQIRGIWFYDADGNVVKPSLVRGKTYTIKIPVYNASFKAPSDKVDIEMQLRKVGKTEDDDEVIIPSSNYPRIPTQSFSIDGWKMATKDQSQDPNKATVTFEWTIPSDLKEGDDYDLYFVIDPENKIDELHENWDFNKDPGGNNVGCYPIAVLEKEPEAYTDATKSGVSTAASESDFELLFQHPGMEDGEWISFEQFRSELTNETDDFRAFAKVIYKGSETLVNLYLDVSRLDPDGTEKRIATKFIPALLPNTERETSFMVSPEKVKQGVFGASLSGGGNASLHWGKASDSINGGSSTSNKSSSGGCDAGFGGLALLGLATLAALGLGKRL